ncbi:site-specific DNA-methyltransferase [Helicobacter sp.]|uniref:DNA-methyltransferase n=1 Tax=Helicobacter sp. TaxID=218 RepID=UPI0019B3BBFC|nr:site-specific DNA-methyltransferase [Helicobacter sp.]MBD5164701.1 site-specific DNA-methyltransferase [Helicobacter sp.]
MLICGEVLCELKKLESDSIDMGITSPPYNKQENKKGWLVKNVKYDTISDKKDEATYQEEQIAVLNELYRIIKPGGSFFYNHKIRWECGVMLHPIFWIAKSKWHMRQEIIWDRGIAANIRGWRFWQVEERIFWLHKPRDKKDFIGQELESKHALLSSIWRIRPENSNTHPAPFPLALPVRCIYSILGDKGGIVIDPYCGSGTSLVAAKSLGCDFIGIDISENYIQSAKIRLQDYHNEQKIIESEKALHQVAETFSQKKARGMHKDKLKKTKEMQPDLFQSTPQ